MDCASYSQLPSLCRRRRIRTIAERLGMNQKERWEVSRRGFLIASAGLALPRLMWAESSLHASLCWTLRGREDVARESILGSDDPISSRTGHAMWVGQGRNRALRLDGYSVWIDHTGPQPAFPTGALTFSAWIALESYPVNEASVVQLGQSAGFACSFDIDKWGYLKLRFHRKSSSMVCTSKAPVPKARWVHVAASLSKSGTVVIYQNGEPCGHESVDTHPLQSPLHPVLTIGRSSDAPVVAGIFPTGVVNGLLKDVRVFDASLPRNSIVQVLEQSRPDAVPNLDINGPWCAADKQRPVYHALPPRAWTNEPHGLIHWGGQYHLFYQKNPNGPYWGHINWGHMTSPDMYRWTEMPVAIAPEPGPDAEGCWSGSVIDYNGKLALIYTGGDGHRASICLALSNDGIHFTKYSGNPIIPVPPQGKGFPEFRDPFVWREMDTYYLIIGSAVKNVGGTALLYRSKDLIHWEYRKPLLIGDHDTSGVFWEMPNFVKVGEHHVLTVCEVPGRASYWVGRWQNETFTPYHTEPRRLELFNHLLSPTPHTSAEGQVITMGIIPDQRDPRECWGAGWAHLYSLPRVLSTDADGWLYQQPLGGIRRLGEPIVSIPKLTLEEGQPRVVEDASGARLHLRTVFRRGKSQSVSLLLRRSPDGKEATEIRYEWSIGRLVLDRRHSSLDPLVVRDRAETTYFPVEKDSIAFEIFLDNSVLEVFVDNRSAFATRIYPTLNISDGIALQCRGTGAVAEDFTVARMLSPA